MKDCSSRKSFCVLPWTHSYVNHRGDYQVCCTSEDFLTALNDQEGNPFNIKNLPNPNDVMNSEILKKLRVDMLNGKWNSICTRCSEVESLGGVSRRIIENSEHPELPKLIEKLVAETSSNGEIKASFKSLDYRLGNLCNLKCRMCAPQSSNAWIKEWNLVKPAGEQITKEETLEFENYDWIEKDLLLKDFRAKAVNITSLHFAGGEPLIIPQMAAMLQTCIDLGVASQITVSYNTNLTKLPMNVLNLWKHFKGIKLLCSVDGFGKVNDYIRHPSKWEVIDKNLKFIDDHAGVYNISEIILSSTVQIYNILELQDLYTYLKKFKNIIKALNLLNLHEPSYMQTTLLPLPAKELATKRLLEIAKEFEDGHLGTYNYLRENIFQIIKFMNQEDHSKKLLIFRKINNSMDKLKGMTLYESIPELNAFLHNHYMNILGDTSSD